MIRSLLRAWPIRAELPLSDQELGAIRRSAKIHYALRPTSLKIREGFIDLVTSSVFVGSVFIVMKRFDNTRFEWITFLTIPILILGCTLIPWAVMRHRSKPYVHRSLAEAGYESCIYCGYWLRGLGDDVKQCPECGAKREPMAQPRDALQ